MTMDNPQTNQDKPQTPVDGTPQGKEPSPVKGEITPEEEPKTLTVKDGAKLAEMASREAGRLRKTAETERDGFRTQSETLTSQVDTLTETIKTLESQIDDLTSNDPSRFEAIKVLREARAGLEALKTDRKVLDSDKEKYGERVTAAENHLREISINEIAADYEGSDSKKLKSVCDLAGANTAEEIKEVAETLWTNKDKKPNIPTLLPFSGRTIGGGDNLGDSPEAKVTRALDKLKKK